MPRKSKNAPVVYELGDIEETIFLDTQMDDEELMGFLNFSIDVKGRTRLGLGIINMDPSSEDDLNFVPMERFEINGSQWNAHQQSITIELPNPATDYEYYKLIRSAFMTEIAKRLPGFTQALPKSVVEALEGPG